ncbi:MAG: CoA-binding protein [Tepidiformaceae bacterium]
MAVPGHRLDRMLNPKTVVVIGDKGPNYMWLKNNFPFRDKGGNLYSVQIDEKEIPGIEDIGITNFKSLADIPEPIDYALVAVPRQVSPYVLKDLIAVKAAGAAFFTSGFAETGEELGVKLQATLTEMAREANFPLVGPNCMGLHLPKVGVRFNADAPVADDGRIGFLAQSGTHGIMFSLIAASQGMNVSRTVSFGNAIVLDVADYVEYLADDDETDVIGMYVEGVKDARRFFNAVKAAAARKPVVIWKGGQTDAGARATMSHTGSLAVPHAVWEGIMKQLGVIVTNTVDETTDVMKVLLQARKPVGPRFALMAQTGGQSVAITDAFGKAGLQIPRFTDETYADFGTYFNIVGGSYQNPLDMGGTVIGNMETLDRIFRTLDADANVDGMCMELATWGGARQWKEKPEMLEAMIDTIATHSQRSQKPFLVILHPAHQEEFIASVRPKFTAKGIPTFPSFDRAAQAVARAVNYFGVNS